MRATFATYKRDLLAPASPSRVIRSASDGVREDCMGLDDEAVAFYSFERGHVMYGVVWMMVFLSIRVVYLDQLIELLLRVDSTLLQLEDIIGCRLRRGFRWRSVARPVHDVSEVVRLGTFDSGIATPLRASELSILRFGGNRSGAGNGKGCGRGARGAGRRMGAETALEPAVCGSQAVFLQEHGKGEVYYVACAISGQQDGMKG